MQYNSHATNQDIVSDITFLTGMDTGGFSLNDRTRCVNERFRLINKIIFESYGGWKFMDDNTSDTSTGIPYADQTLTSGTGLYAVPTGTQAINGVEIKNSGGTYDRLSPLNYEEFLGMGGDAAFTSTGVPLYYLLQGDVIRILPIPNYTVASTGLRVFFDQGISTFAASDTTKVPGFDSDFHRMLSIGAALDFCITHPGMEGRVNSLQGLWNDYERRLRLFYAKRWTDNYPHRVKGRHDIVSRYT